MEHSLELANGSRVVLPAFRGDVPTYVPPDRDAWKAKRGAAPFSLGPVHAKYVSRARAAVQLDADTISFAEAMLAQEKLEAVTARVQADADLPETTLVFFDPKDGTFWAYPNA